MIITKSAHSQSAKNHFIYFGGGSSTDPKDSFFAEGYKKLWQMKTNRAWNSELYFRKLSPSEQDLQKNYPADGTFNKEIFQKKIKDLTKKIWDGKIKDGEQLLLLIDTHGGIDQNENYMVLADNDLTTTDLLRKLAQAAEKKKVKLAIIGTTCYSGNLMSLKTPNNCIIASGQKDQLSYSGFGSILFDEIVHAKNLSNLEDAYLNSRNELAKSIGSYPHSPMISTSEGEHTAEQLKTLKNTLFHSVDLKRKFRTPSCPNLMNGFENLAKQAQGTHLITRTIFPDGKSETEKEPFLDIFTKLVTSYQELYDRNSEYEFLKNKEHCLGSQCYTFAQVDSDKFFKKLPFEFHLSLKSNPSYEKYSQLKRQSGPDIKRMEKISAEISRYEKLLYNDIYRQLKGRRKTSNPCNDFKI